MTEVLTQDEIDQLLTAIRPGDDVPAYTIKEFEDMLVKRNREPEKLYGFYSKDIIVCRYFDNGNNESILNDIKLKNEEEGLGNFKIPDTDIMLLNYSFCHNCKTIFSFKEVTEYYMNPKPDPNFKNRAMQYREDTRVCCKNCNTYFLPSLVIADGTPINEVQFLCRAQTINAVEKYFLQKNNFVLTKKKENIIYKGKFKAIKNDVYLKDLHNKPTLITNMVQYTPFKYISNMIDGTNVRKGDLLFDYWDQV